MIKTIVLTMTLLSPVAVAQEANSQIIGDLLERMESLQKEIAVLRDKNERLRHEFDQFKIQTEKRLSQSQPTDNSAPNMSSTTDTAIVEPPQSEDTDNFPSQINQEDLSLPDDNEYFAYRNAMVALQDADYESLRRKLSQFLRQYPNGKYAANAKYWIAETYYIEENYERAQHYYNRIITEHTDRPKYEDALLKIAYIREARQEWEGARTILQKLATSAKQEKLRKIAQSHLERLDKERQ